MGAVQSGVEAVGKTAEATVKFLDLALSLVKVLTQLAGGIIWVFKVIEQKGLLAGIAALIRMLLGFTITVAVIILGPLFNILFTLFYKYVGPSITALFYTVVLIIIVPVKLAISLFDCALGGRLRFLEFSHDSPDAWWQRAGYERGNRYARFVLSWLPCCKGYLPSASGIACVCEPSDMPRCSPGTLLVRHYLWGSFRDWGRKLPERNAEALKRFRSMCAREYASVFRDPTFGKYARDLVESLILARSAVFSKVADIDELATYASWTTRAAGGRVVIESDNDVTHTCEIATDVMPWWPLIMLSSSVAVAAVIAWRVHGSRLLLLSHRRG